MPNNASAYYDAPPPWMQGGYAAPAHGVYAAPMQMPGGFPAPVGVELGAPAGGKRGGKRGGRGGGAPQTATFVMPGGARYVVPINQGGAQQQQHHHQTRAQQAHEHWNVVKRLAILNGIPATELTDSKLAGKILDRVVGMQQIKLAGIDQFRAILARYITYKHWELETSAAIQDRFLNNYEFDLSYWTPKRRAAAGDNGTTSKTALRFGKELKKIVDKALKSARAYGRRSTAAAAAAATHPNPGPASDARFTSMRFP